MSSEQAFLRAILDDPDDDAHRLVYADWLDDTGERPNRDRAEFIRAQCQLARLPDDAPERPGLTRREQALLKKYARRWAEPFRELITWWTFRRGFLEAAVVRTEGMGKRFVPLFKQLIDGTPLRGICLFEQFGQPKVLLDAAPDMTRLREFGVRNGHLHGEGAAYRKLLHSPFLAGLTALDLEGPRDGSWFRPRVLSAILKSPVLSNLTSLLLSDYITALHPSTLAAIATSPSLANLRRLGIMSTPLDRAGMRALGEAAFAGRLEVLELQWCRLDEGASDELLSGRVFPNLKKLYLGGADFNPDGLGQARERFGPGAVDLELELPARPHYHSWSKE